MKLKIIISITLVALLGIGGMILAQNANSQINSNVANVSVNANKAMTKKKQSAHKHQLVPRPKCSTYLSESDAGKVIGKQVKLSSDQLTGESLKLVGDRIVGGTEEICQYRWRHSSSFQIEATFELFPTAHAAKEPLSGFKKLADEQNSRRDPRIQEFESIAGIGDEAWIITSDESIEICVQKGATLFSIRLSRVQLVSIDELKRVAKKVAKQF